MADRRGSAGVETLEPIASFRTHQVCSSLLNVVSLGSYTTVCTVLDDKKLLPNAYHPHYSEKDCVRVRSFNLLDNIYQPFYGADNSRIKPGLQVTHRLRLSRKWLISYAIVAIGFAGCDGSLSFCKSVLVVPVALDRVRFR
jgi:hypothetical protein